MNRLRAALSLARVSALGLTLVVAVAVLATPTESHATVMVTGPAPGSAVNNLFFGLDIPPIGGALDERGFSGFEYLLSGVDPAVNDFTANDMYIVQGNDTNPDQTLRTNLGGRDDLSGVPMNFSIQHNLVGGRNFTFSIENTMTSMTSVLCWGLNCAPGSIASETINGEFPFAEFNGLQIQVRAQDVPGATTSVEILSLTGISSIIGDPLFNETVDPTLPGTLQTILGPDNGRRGQWLIADNLDFLVNEWELAGIVTLSRPDGALSDRTKVRLAIDLVRDPNFPSVIPEPSTALLVGFGLAGLATRRRGV